MTVLIHPKNQDFLDQKAHFPAKLMDGSRIIWVIIICGFAFLLLYVMFDMFRRDILIKDHAETTGIVTRRYQERGRFENHYTLYYSFEANGTTYQSSQNVSSSTYKSHQVDDPISICYALADSNVNDLVEDCNEQIQFLMFIPLMFVILVAVVMTQETYVYYQKIKLFKSYNATVLTNVFEVEREGQSKIKVTIRFETPDTHEVIIGTRIYDDDRQPFFSRQASSFPNDSTMAIFYHNRQVWEVL